MLRSHWQKDQAAKQDPPETPVREGHSLNDDEEDLGCPGFSPAESTWTEKRAPESTSKASVGASAASASKRSLSAAMEDASDSDDSICPSKRPKPENFLLRRIPSSPSGRCERQSLLGQDWETRPGPYPSISWYISPMKLAIAPILEARLQQGTARPFRMNSYCTQTWFENIVWQGLELPAHDRRCSLSEIDEGAREFLQRAHVQDFQCLYHNMAAQATGLGRCDGHGVVHTEMKPMRACDLLSGGTMCVAFSTGRRNKKAVPAPKHPEWMCTFGSGCNTLREIHHRGGTGSLLELIKTSPEIDGGILEQVGGFTHEDEIPDGDRTAADHFARQIQELQLELDVAPPTDSETITVADGADAACSTAVALLPKKNRTKARFPCVIMVKLNANVWVTIERPRRGSA